MKSKQEMQQMLIEKAMKDESFRQELLENPKNAIGKEMGVQIPESVNIKVLEEDPQTFYLILPKVTEKGAEGELTEAELAGVSGGTFTIYTDEIDCY